MKFKVKFGVKNIEHVKFFSNNESSVIILVFGDRGKFSL